MLLLLLSTRHHVLQIYFAILIVLLAFLTNFTFLPLFWLLDSRQSQFKNMWGHTFYTSWKYPIIKLNIQEMSSEFYEVVKWQTNVESLKLSTFNIKVYKPHSQHAVLMILDKKFRYLGCMMLTVNCIVTMIWNWVTNLVFQALFTQLSTSLNDILVPKIMSFRYIHGTENDEVWISKYEELCEKLPQWIYSIVFCWVGNSIYCTISQHTNDRRKLQTLVR